MPRPETGIFVAVDFETACEDRASACSVGLARVEGGRIVARLERLIRPPSPHFSFSSIHGLTWKQVEGAPRFGSILPEIEAFTEGAAFLAAHNAPFDRSVWTAAAAAEGLVPTGLPFLCTVRLARRAFGIYPTTLPDVCRSLEIPLRHHQAASDAEAAARIVLAVRRQRPDFARDAEALSILGRSASATTSVVG